MIYQRIQSAQTMTEGPDPVRGLRRIQTSALTEVGMVEMVLALGPLGAMLLVGAWRGAAWLIRR